MKADKLNRAMPLCDGRGLDGPCPDRRNDGSVKLSQGDLMLCPSCDAHRFPPTHTASKKSSVSVSKSGSTSQHPVAVNEAACSSRGSAVTGQNDKADISEKKKPSHADSLVVSDVLCFIRNKYDNYPLSTIKSTICDFYRDDEILSAKVALLQAVSDGGLNTQQYAKNRVGPNKSKANTDDIINLWSLVDENGLFEQMPTYCCVNTSRIPSLNDELSDLAFLRKTVLDLQKELNELKAELNNGLSSLALQIAHPPAPETTSVRPSAVIADQQIKVVSVANDLPSDAGSSSSADREATDNVLINCSNSFASLAQSIRSGDFQEVRNKKKQTKRVVIGDSKSSAGFKGIVKKSVFCINRLEPNTSTDIISDFLKSNNIPVYSCYLLKSRQSSVEKDDDEDQHDTRRFVSMRICVPQTEGIKVMSPGLWPEGVTVRPWIFKTAA